MNAFFRERIQSENDGTVRRPGRSVGLPVSVIAFMSLVQIVNADTFTVKEDTGNLAKIDAVLVGEAQGVVALERTDGRIEVVPQQQIVERVVAANPAPISCEVMIERLTEKFGAEKFKAYAEAPYVIGLVLSEPLPKIYEAKATTCLKKGAGFMKTVEKVFLDFTNDLKLETEKPKYPLVLLIFETDEDFTQFAAEETGGRGLAAGSMLGYYNGLSNRLVIRMSECLTFTTPLHEAIHQQVYNRGLIHRLSPVPVWFHEGIATGFEGNGEKINGGPLKVSSRYARTAMRAQKVNWDDVVGDDKAFRGDVLASEAYAHAWSIHWFLVTKYRKQYIKYLQMLGEKQPLQLDSPETRTQDFEQAFGKRVGQLQTEFRPWLERAAKKQNISFADKQQPGHSISQSNLAEVEVIAMKSPLDGSLQVHGQMRNISQIRPMSFYITMETDTGTYAEWFLPNVPPTKGCTLGKQSPEKQMKDAPGGNAETFRVRVKAVVPDSETGKSWQRGHLPVPVFQGS